METAESAQFHTIPKPLFRGFFLVVIVMIGLASCRGGSTPDSIPPLELSVGGDRIELSAFVSCWQDLCADGISQPPEFVVPVGQPIEVRFSQSGWTLQGQDPTNGVWLLDPLPAASAGEERTITGRGPEGDGAWSVRLVPDSANQTTSAPTTVSIEPTTVPIEPTAAPAADADVFESFAAAVVAGDRAAAALVADPDVLAFLDPWGPWPDAFAVGEENGTFPLVLEPEFTIRCELRDGRVRFCAEVLPGEPGPFEPDGSPQRLSFPAGEYGAFVSGGIVRGQSAVYVLEATGGQSMVLALSSVENNAVYEIVDPLGNRLAVEQVAGAVLLPSSGDYQIVVGSTRGNASYDLDVYVFPTDQVSFDAGTSGTTISGAVIRGERAVYLLEASGGQTMEVSISSLEDNAVFDIYPPLGPPLVTETAGSRQTLPENGIYQIVVSGTRGNATYDLEVSIVG